MKKSTSSSRVNQGFTLIELLVVIAIIGILAAMLLPVLKSVKEKEKIARTRMQMAEIVTAIHEYEGPSGRFPVSRSAIDSVAASGDDFTFGGVYNTPNGAHNVQASGSYHPDNSEVMAVLMNLEKFGNGQATVNQGHLLNTEARSFLTAVTMSGDNSSPGVGTDGVYRDPWGTPYIISVDLNHDEKTRDAFYQDPRVSADASNLGLNGLIQRALSNGAFVFEINSPVGVWSAGPDKLIDPNISNLPAGKANKGANKDNILSWK